MKVKNSEELQKVNGGAENIENIKDRVGEEFSTNVVITRDQIISFVEVTGDANQVHYDESRSRESILASQIEGKIIVPGFLSLSLCANREIFFNTLAKGEPHEQINLGLSDVKFIAPVYNDLDIEYNFVIKSVKDTYIKGKKSAKVEWEILVSKVVGEEKVLCMKATWFVAYVSLK